MATWQNVQARQGSDSLLRGFQAREFASNEFPDEDYRWVLASVEEAPVAGKRPGLFARLARTLRRFRTPGENESDSEATTERAPA